MYYSHVFSKTSKTVPADADSVNAQLLTQAGFIAKQMAGVYIFLPLGLRVLNKIQDIIREELNAAGAQEILMPALTQNENYTITGRDALDILFHLEGPGGSQFVLNLSHEEVVTPLVQKYVFSHRDLPTAVYQIQNKFRNEPRAKSGLLRGREFNMKDLYSFHPSSDDLNVYYERMKQVYFSIYRRLGLGDQVVFTYASGGTFSRYSHEFQALCPIGEDTVYVCDHCRVGVNKELGDEQNSCPECHNVDLTEKKAIEVGNIFKLGQRFSSAFGFKYQDTGGQLQPVEMGCYGMGPSRIMGTLVEIFHDQAGMLWPESVAPFKVHLLTLGKEEAGYSAGDKMYQELRRQGIEVLYDDRRDASAGAKFADADLLGIPWRVVISPKTLTAGGVEVKRRDSEQSEIVPTAKLSLVLGRSA